MNSGKLAEVTVVDLLIHTDPVVRWLMQQLVSRFDELEQEQKKQREANELLRTARR